MYLECSCKFFAMLQTIGTISNCQDFRVMARRQKLVLHWQLAPFLVREHDFPPQLSKQTISLTSSVICALSDENSGVANNLASVSSSATSLPYFIISYTVFFYILEYEK